MERFTFDSHNLLKTEFENRITSFEASGNTHREALELLLIEIEDQVKNAHLLPSNQQWWSDLQSARGKVDSYIKQLRWFETNGYPPRIRIEDYDYEDTRQRAKAFGSRVQQIRYLEQVVAEYWAFSKTYPSRFDYKFGDKIEAEIKALKMELEFAKRPDSEKLAWNWKTAEFGHLFSQLFHLQYIGFTDKGEINYSKLARICIELFDLEDKPSVEYLATQLNPEKNSLSEESKKRFRIPDQKELNPKRAKKSKES